MRIKRYRPKYFLKVMFFCYRPFYCYYLTFKMFWYKKEMDKCFTSLFLCAIVLIAIQIMMKILLSLQTRKLGKGFSWLFLCAPLLLLQWGQISCSAPNEPLLLERQKAVNKNKNCKHKQNSEKKIPSEMEVTPCYTLLILLTLLLFKLLKQ